MRIISGKLGGLQFDSPSGHRTHPMSEKIRGALFNALGDISGLTFLDPYSGSGAVAFEAISRGAVHVTAIEIDKLASITIENNLKKLKPSPEKVKIIRANAVSWSELNPLKQFDVVVCDPPYDAVNADALEVLINHTKKGGVAVLSLPPHFVFAAPDGYSLLSTKEYGDARLFFYRRLN